nr:J domain-containing protein [Desulforamulus aquiferis]
MEEAYRGGNKTIQLLNKVLEVKVPSGVQDGSKIRLKGQGEEGNYGGEPGDLYLKISILSHPHFTIKGKDIESRVSIRPEQAVLGEMLELETLDGKIKVRIPPMSKNGKKLRLRNKGWPGKKGERGDHYIEVVIDIPDSLTDNERELYEKLANLRSFDSRQAS